MANAQNRDIDAWGLRGPGAVFCFAPCGAGQGQVQERIFEFWRSLVLLPAENPQADHRHGEKMFDRNFFFFYSLLVLHSFIVYSHRRGIIYQNELPMCPAAAGLYNTKTYEFLNLFHLKKEITHRVFQTTSLQPFLVPHSRMGTRGLSTDIASRRAPSTHSAFPLFANYMGA